MDGDMVMMMAMMMVMVMVMVQNQNTPNSNRPPVLRWTTRETPWLGVIATLDIKGLKNVIKYPPN